MMLAVMLLQQACALQHGGLQTSRRLSAEGGEGWAERPAVPGLAQQRSETPKEERVPWEFGRFLKQTQWMV